MSVVKSKPIPYRSRVITRARAVSPPQPISQPPPPTSYTTKSTMEYIVRARREGASKEDIITGLMGRGVKKFSFIELEGDEKKQKSYSLVETTPESFRYEITTTILPTEEQLKAQRQQQEYLQHIKDVQKTPEYRGALAYATRTGSTQHLEALMRLPQMEKFALAHAQRTGSTRFLVSLYQWKHNLSTYDENVKLHKKQQKALALFKQGIVKESLGFSRAEVRELYQKTPEYQRQHALEQMPDFFVGTKRWKEPIEGGGYILVEQKYTPQPDYGMEIETTKTTYFPTKQTAAKQVTQRVPTNIIPDFSYFGIQKSAMGDVRKIVTGTREPVVYQWTKGKSVTDVLYKGAEWLEEKAFEGGFVEDVLRGLGVPEEKIAEGRVKVIDPIYKTIQPPAGFKELIYIPVGVVGSVETYWRPDVQTFSSAVTGAALSPITQGEFSAKPLTELGQKRAGYVVGTMIGDFLLGKYIVSPMVAPATEKIKGVVLKSRAYHAYQYSTFMQNIRYHVKSPVKSWISRHITYSRPYQKVSGAFSSLKYKIKGTPLMKEPLPLKKAEILARERAKAIANEEFFESWAPIREKGVPRFDDYSLFSGHTGRPLVEKPSTYEQKIISEEWERLRPITSEDIVEATKRTITPYGGVVDSRSAMIEWEQLRLVYSPSARHEYVVKLAQSTIKPYDLEHIANIGIEMIKPITKESIVKTAQATIKPLSPVWLKHIDYTVKTSIPFEATKTPFFKTFDSKIPYDASISKVFGKRGEVFIELFKLPKETRAVSTKLIEKPKILEKEVRPIPVAITKISKKIKDKKRQEVYPFRDFGVIPSKTRMKKKWSDLQKYQPYPKRVTLLEAYLKVEPKEKAITEISQKIESFSGIKPSIIERGDQRERLFPVIGLSLFVSQKLATPVLPAMAKDFFDKDSDNFRKQKKPPPFKIDVPIKKGDVITGKRSGYWFKRVHLILGPREMLGLD